ncbi:MAG: class I SAM-dependent methyltransferase [Chloroflexi bacterium]|nr:class I SAM-dependent methyltransferase [Chloroflexota bacterium]
MDAKTAALERLRPAVERARKFGGWVFSDLNIRHLGPELPWDYPQLVRERARDRRSALDMGTGPGERLAALRDSLPERLVATEEWPTNAPVAYQRLTSLGIDVVHCRSLQLSFRDEAFDLVLNRHDDLDPAEVARVLQPGGELITQQVGRDNWRELRRRFPRATDWGDVRGTYTRGFTAAGLEVTADRQHEYRVAFPSLSELVFMLTVAPWTIPEFDLDRDAEALLEIESDCQTNDGLVLTESRFLIVAEKPV